MKKSIFIVLLSLIFLAACTDQVIVTNFDECVEAGNPVLESYPERCIHQGQEFVNENSLAPNCSEEYETFCPSLGECVTVWNTLCPEYEEFYTEPFACTREYNPVCAVMAIPNQENNIVLTTVTFSNECLAQNYGALEYNFGVCDDLFIFEDKYETCELLGGNALPEFNECEYISENDCNMLEGEFFECESACRNDPAYPDVICTMQCVHVCSFE
jgi:hypothetical protein